MQRTAFLLSALMLLGANGLASAAGQEGTFDCATIKEKKVRLSCEKAVARTAPVDEKTAARTKFVGVAKRSIAEKMVDPSSVQFRNTIYVESALHKDGEPTRHVLCGEVNAKNRYGGYVGLKPYFVDTGSNYPESLHAQVCDGDGPEASVCIMGMDIYCTKAVKEKTELPDS